ncbi:4Fe-4S dicluster domain-containing protein [Candidatus Methylacidiphilum fumarolicum]|uniref:NADH-quinone oxidoreductase subunit I n=2 Tax=Candidatus Methylacidiphilum fumarolicum TaxID=591154 RepID=I0K0W7_METFB|nr:NADH-quinone oxidoreductase subunit I [Candidatus Methylacidiphilum fumarolicum]MBW6413991.1 NADH-quinone oxidoreductase subunit I [Candidatus Methylacidiphilum fumarolicum]TFE70531.1 NADH dehydrogenase [Candidatus Methylacidiphilum fumarolicum]TFE74816.1 4Fe-4S dicluster domain-containing protein [Candidatus Methylacidiphilum fumarolicum]TFE76003.1 4Fe-4S dicluster domain-containing protein [Candidatus Methylacidiphilum fumarolicum]TFE76417.1 NADH dehydrogenase [Candidatus Methylacidiphilu
MIVKRPTLSFIEKTYLPGILQGLGITLKHFWDRVRGKTKITLEYPEEKPQLPEGLRGAPLLVKDEEGREKCVSCQFCEFICPPRAIRIIPGEIPLEDKYAKVEKAPKEFFIDMTRCIYCGLCEEVCPEEAIFLLPKIYSLSGYSRKELIHDKKTLYELGGIYARPIKKWEKK